jgi:hypothetical protein
MTPAKKTNELMEVKTRAPQLAREEHQASVTVEQAITFYFWKP